MTLQNGVRTREEILSKRAEIGKELSKPDVSPGGAYALYLLSYDKALEWVLVD